VRVIYLFIMNIVQW